MIEHYKKAPLDKNSFLQMIFISHIGNHIHGHVFFVFLTVNLLLNLAITHTANVCGKTDVKMSNLIKYH